MQNADQELQCVSCDRRFVFTSGEQAYFEQHGFQPPRRCKDCRLQHKASSGFARDNNQNSGGYANNGQAPRYANNGGGFAHRPQQDFRPARQGGGGGGGGYRRDDGYRPQGGFRPEPRNDHNGVGYGQAEDVEESGDDQYNGNTFSPRREMDDRLGMRAPMTNYGRRNNYRTDRTGTDPNAYRAPGYHQQGGGGAGGGGGGGGFRNHQNQGGHNHGGHGHGHGHGGYSNHGQGQNNPGYGGMRRVYNYDDRGGGQHRLKRELHETKCIDCGAEARVPFVPGPDRPAYCKTCYQFRKENGTVMDPTAPSVSMMQGNNPTDQASEPGNSAPVGSDNAPVNVAAPAVTDAAVDGSTVPVSTT